MFTRSRGDGVHANPFRPKLEGDATHGTFQRRLGHQALQPWRNTQASSALSCCALVAGVLPDDEVATSNARPQFNLMSALINRLAPKGLYALSVDRQGRTPEIHCVFATEVDALKRAATPVGEASARSRSMPKRAGQSPLP